MRYVEIFLVAMLGTRCTITAVHVVLIAVARKAKVHRFDNRNASGLLPTATHLSDARVSSLIYLVNCSSKMDRDSQKVCTLQIRVHTSRNRRSERLRGNLLQHDLVMNMWLISVLRIALYRTLLVTRTEVTQWPPFVSRSKSRRYDRCCVADRLVS